jgi:hypothetical protein
MVLFEAEHAFTPVICCAILTPPVAYPLPIHLSRHSLSRPHHLLYSDFDLHPLSLLHPYPPPHCHHDLTRAHYTIDPLYYTLHKQAPDLRSRVSTTAASTTNHQSDEAARRARALAEYEADRDIVKERVKREKIVREVREAKAKEAAEAAALAEANGETEPNAQANHDDEEEEEEEESSEDEEDEDGSKRYARQMRRAGKGQRLGGGQVLGK